MPAALTKPLANAFRWVNDVSQVVTATMRISLDMSVLLDPRVNDVVKWALREAAGTLVRLQPHSFTSCCRHRGLVIFKYICAGEQDWLDRVCCA